MSASRPRNPSGFVRLHPDTKSKRWQGVVKYPDPDRPGKWNMRSATFERKAEAQAWVDRALAEHRANPQYRPPSDEAFDQFLARWLSDVAKGRIRETTWNAYFHAAQPLLERIGPKPLKQVTPIDIQAVYTECLSSGRFKPATLRITHNVCRQALQDAVDWGLIPTNPALWVKPPRVPRPAVHPPTPDEARRLFQVADAHPWRALWYVLALTGCRRGEALGLQWPDVDWDHRTLTIQRTLVGKASRRYTREPKTASGRRVVAVSRFLLDCLREHRHRQLVMRVSAGSAWQDTGFVFTTRSGRPLDGDNVRREFKKLLAAAALPPDMRIHDLRHAMATTWLARGVPAKVVSERLGHASIAITLQLYGHVLPNLQAEAADAMDAWLLQDPAASPRRHHEEEKSGHP